MIRSFAAVAVVFAVVCGLAASARAEDSERLRCGRAQVSELESGDRESYQINQPNDRVVIDAIDISNRLGLLKLAVAGQPDTATCSGVLSLDGPSGVIEVSDCIVSDDTSGQYTVSMNVASDSRGNCGTALSCGVPTAGQLSVAGEVDSYVFAASGDGSWVALSLASTPAPPQRLRMRVFDPQGVPIPGADTCDGTVSVRPANPGRYTVLVGACAQPVTGPYTIMRDTADCSVSLAVGSAAGAPGQQVSVNVLLDTNGHQVAGTENDISFDPDAPIAAKANGAPNCTVNPLINKDATTFRFQPAGCEVGDCESVHALVFAIDNNDPIDDESILYTCRVNLPATGSTESFPLSCANAVASTPDGARLPSQCSSGMVTASTNPCPGDCDGNGAVSVAELVTAVNIALGFIDPSECSALDTNHDGHVGVEELVMAVNSALDGCTATTTSQVGPG